MFSMTTTPAPSWPAPGRPLTLSNTDVVFLGAAISGWLAIVRSDAAMARFRMRGGFNTTVEELDDASVYSATKDTASMINVYYDASGPSGAGYYIQSLHASTRQFRLYLWGQPFYPLS